MNASLSRLWADYGLSVQISDYHRAQLRRAGLILAASIVGLNVALVLVALVVAVLR